MAKASEGFQQAMGALTSWVYPLQGMVYLTSSPQLFSTVFKFILLVTTASAACAAVWMYLFWNLHLGLVSAVVGVNMFSRLVTLVVLLAESAVPVYLLFDRQFEGLQHRLFDATLRLKGITVEPLQQRDQQTLDALLAKQHKQRREQQQNSSNSITGLVSQLGGSALSMATRIILKPQPKEGLLLRKTRDAVTLAATVFVPFLVPLVAVRDSHAEAANLLSRYWQRKGIPSAEGQQVVAEQLRWELRGFGMVAATLAYIPVLNWFLGLSNTVGAALFAADLERKQAPLLAKGAKAS